MGDIVKLTASDGNELEAYLAKAAGEVKGGLVIIQEIFGVNSHIRSVCDRFAEDGYTTIAPALFDRLEPNTYLDYDQAGMEKGISLMNQIAPEVALKDIEAAFDHIKDVGKVSVMGFCWGGALTFMSAASPINFYKAIGYYGGGIPRYIEMKPQIPTLLHFGKEDHAIPLDQVEELKQTHPEIEVHLYDAGHGFNCDVRGSYDKASADLARSRSLDFIEGA